MRAWLQSVLWGTRALPQAQASLRRELSNLRAAIAGPPLIHSDHLRIWIDLAHMEVAPSRRDSAAEFLEGLDLPSEEGFEDWLRDQRALSASGVRQDLPSPSAHGLASQAPVSQRPSIVVLPFADLDPIARHHIADGVVDEITIVLSRYPSLSVIASGTGLSFREARPDHRAIAQELGVRYLLDGSVRVSGDRVRISARLIDGVEGRQLWADRFEDSLANIFEMQDRVALVVAQLIDSSIEKAEMRRAGSRPVNHLDAYQLYWQANAAFRDWEPQAMLRAIETAEHILRLEPENSWALSLIGFCHASNFASGWSKDPAAQRALALSFADRALHRGWDDAQVLGYTAGTLAQVGGDIDAARRMIDRALALNPGSAAIQFWGGWINICGGAPEEALRLFETALRLNPRSAVRPFHESGMGIARFLMRDYEPAIALLRDAARGLPNHPPTFLTLSAALAYVGRIGEAREIVGQFGNSEIEAIIAIMLREPAHRVLLLEGIALARGSGAAGPRRIVS